MSSSRRYNTRAGHRITYFNDDDDDDDDEFLLDDGSSSSDDEPVVKRRRAAAPRRRPVKRTLSDVDEDQQEEDAAAVATTTTTTRKDSDDDYDDYEDDDEELVECNECGYLIGALSAYFHCRDCEQNERAASYDLCESCYFETEGASHPHLLDYVKAKPDDKPLYSLQDPASKHWVHLGAYASALPDSATLVKLHVGAVLSLMCIDDNSKETPASDKDEHRPNTDDEEGFSDTSMEAILRLFGQGTGRYQQTVNVGPRRVVYHHINLPDLADPALLLENGVADVLEEATLFVDAALKVTNVLVHCQFGQRRSPSVFMAWMITKGYSLKQALRSVNAKYRASTNWAEGYCRRRRLWLAKLVVWKRDHRLAQKAWFDANRPKVKQWFRSLKQLQASAAPTVEPPTSKRQRST